MFGLFSKKPAPAGFWGWLEENSARVKAGLKRNAGAVADEVGREFGRAYPGLLWEVGVEAEGPWLFCVSANGDRAKFRRVRRAVDDAPRLKGWKVKAFRQRGPLTVEIEMGGRKLSYDDIWCRVRPAEGGVRVALLVRGMTEESEPLLGPAAVILLDNAVGEYDAAAKIARLDRGALPADPVRRADFFPLAELPAYLDGVGEG